MKSDLFVAVLDTCVLAPMPLCDTLLRMAEFPPLYLPKWSGGILRELESTLKRMGYSPAQATRRIEAMQAAFEDAEVQGYEPLIPSMTNHPKDRHVLAAAVHTNADVIVTSNTKDFGPESTRPHDISVLTPDEFLLNQFRTHGDLLAERLLQQASARAISIDSLFEKLQHWAPTVVRLMK